MIRILVNHQPKEITDNSSLNLLLETLEISKDGIAIAINNEIITKTIWGSTILEENDTVTIIQATQGG